MRLARLIFVALCCVTYIGVCNGAGVPAGCKYYPTNDGIVAQQKFVSEHKAAGKMKLNWEYKCSTGAGRGGCVRWPNVNVLSHAQAILLAQAYGKKRHNADFICSRGYLKCGSSSQPHIMCTSIDGKYPYEFVFNSISETNDYKFRTGVGTAACQVFLGNDVKAKHGSREKVMSCTSQSLNPSDLNKNCHAMEEELLKPKFGWGVYYYGNDYCMMHFGANPGTNMRCDKLIRNDFGDDVINPQRFKTMQGVLNEEMITWLGTWTQSQLGKSVNNFSCKYTSTLCDAGDVISNAKQDELLECSADGKTITFLFDDLSESKNRQLNRTNSAMTCMSTGGNFDGKRCRGLSRAECDCLNGIKPKEKTFDGKECKQIPGGTKWDNDLDSCVLKAAEKVENANKIKQWGLSVGIPVLLVGVTIASGGATTPLLVLAAGAASAGMSVASNTIKEVNSAQYNKFTTRLNNCQTNTCVKIELEAFINGIQQGEYSVSDDQIMTLDDIMAKKMQLLINKDKNNYSNVIANQRGKKSVRELVTVGLDVGAVIIGFIPLAKSVSGVSGLFNNMPKTAKVLKDMALTTEKIADYSSKGDAVVSTGKEVLNLVR